MNALLLAPLLLVQTPKWATYDAKADGFSILMPGPTQMQPQTTMGVTTHIFISQAQPFVCIASRTALTPAMKAADVAGMNKAMTSSMLASSRSTASGEKAATYAGIAGQQTAFKTANGGGGASWIGQKGRAVYFITLVKQGGASPAEVAKFLGSLRVR